MMPPRLLLGYLVPACSPDVNWQAVTGEFSGYHGSDQALQLSKHDGAAAFFDEAHSIVPPF
jgi:hypothetical protein